MHRELGFRRLVPIDPAHVQTVLDICRMTLTEKAVSARKGALRGNALVRAWRPIFRTVENRTQLTRDEGARASVYVVSSGRGDDGPAAWWLPQLLSSADNTVALAGFCSAGTVGGQLLSLAQAGLGERRRLTGDITWPGGATMPMAQVEADIAALSGYSAHADQAGLLDWIFDIREDLRSIESRLVFIQHGGNAQRLELAKAIEAQAQEEGVVITQVPLGNPDVWYDLDRNALEISEDLRVRQMEEIARLSREVARRRTSGQ